MKTNLNNFDVEFHLELISILFFFCHVLNDYGKMFIDSYTGTFVYMNALAQAYFDFFIL